MPFRGGNEACVHLHDRPGGGPFCAACCRVVLTHSLPQACLLRRNLITVFSGVNNPAQFFLRRAAGPRAPLPANGCPRAIAARVRSVAMQIPHVRKRPRFSHFSQRSTFARACIANPRRTCRERADRIFRRPGTDPRHGPRNRADGASHKPICAKLRKPADPRARARRTSSSIAARMRSTHHARASGTSTSAWKPSARRRMHRSASSKRPGAAKKNRPHEAAGSGIALRGSGPQPSSSSNSA